MEKKNFTPIIAFVLISLSLGYYIGYLDYKSDSYAYAKKMEVLQEAFSSKSERDFVSTLDRAGFINGPTERPKLLNSVGLSMFIVFLLGLNILFPFLKMKRNEIQHGENEHISMGILIGIAWLFASVIGMFILVLISDMFKIRLFMFGVEESAIIFAAIISYTIWTTWIYKLKGRLEKYNIYEYLIYWIGMTGLMIMFFGFVFDGLRIKAFDLSSGDTGRLLGICIGIFVIGILLIRKQIKHKKKGKNDN